MGHVVVDTAVVLRRHGYDQLTVLVLDDVNVLNLKTGIEDQATDGLDATLAGWEESQADAGDDHFRMTCLDTAYQRCLSRWTVH